MGALPTVQGPANFWQQDKCSGKRDQLFLWRWATHALWKLPQQAFFQSTERTSGSSMLPLPVPLAARDGGRLEDGRHSRQAGHTSKDVPRSAEKSSYQGVEEADIHSAAPKCWTSSTGRSHQEGRWLLQGATSMSPQSSAGERRRCSLLLAGTTQDFSTQWRSGWRRAPPGRPPTTWSRKDAILVLCQLPDTLSVPDS